MDERVTTPDFKLEDPENSGRVNPYCFLLQPSSYQQSYMIGGYAIDELKHEYLCHALYAFEFLLLYAGKGV